MSEQENVTQNQVGIPTAEGVKNVNPELLKSWKDEAFTYLKAEAVEKAKFKDLVKTIADSTGIKKGIISKWLKARYEDKIKDLSQVTETLEALNSTVEPPETEG